MNREHELDHLGTQLLIARDFFNSGFTADVEVEDPIRNEKIRVSEMFVRPEAEEQPWLMAEASLPGVLAIKAVGISTDGVLLETAPLDVVRVNAILEERGLAFTFKKGGFYSIRGPKKCVISVSHPAEVAVEQIEGEEQLTVGPRCLWIMRLKDLTLVQQATIISLADAVYAENAFVEEEVELDASGSAGSVGQVRAMVQRLEQTFQLRLMLEQKPVLMMAQKMGMRGEMQQQLQVTQLFALQRQMLAAATDEQTVIRLFQEITAKLGQKRLMDAIIWTLAGKLVQANPKLTYKAARAVVRKKLNARG